MSSGSLVTVYQSLLIEVCDYAHFFLVFLFSKVRLVLEIGHSVCIYTINIGKSYLPGLFLLLFPGELVIKYLPAYHWI